MQVGQGVFGEVGGQRKFFGASSKEKPAYHGHSTSIQSGWEISVSAELFGSPGICGNGVYSFAAEDPVDQDALANSWRRGVSGGYGRDCLIVFRAHDVLISGAGLRGETMVPPGATTWQKDCFSHDVAEVCSGSLNFVR